MEFDNLSRRMAEQPKLMDEMVERVGVDRNVAEAVDGGLAWFAARTKCVFCREPQLCANWLNGQETSAAPHDFCPNTRFFGGLTDAGDGSTAGRD